MKSGIYILLTLLLSVSHLRAQVYSQNIVGYMINSTVGWEFTPTQDVWITSLGWLGAGSFAQPSDQPSLGLWSADGTLLTSATIGADSSLVNGTLYEAISPILIAAGTPVVLGIGSSSTNIVLLNIIPHSLNALFDYDGIGQVSSNGFTFPTISTAYDSLTDRSVAGATFLFSLAADSGSPATAAFVAPVPEPGLPALVLSAASILGILRWRRS